MAVLGREQLVHQHSGRRGPRRVARAVELTVLGWAMSLLAVSLERLLVRRDERAV